MHPNGRKTLRRTPTEADKKTERSPEKQKKSKKAKKNVSRFARVLLTLHPFIQKKKFMIRQCAILFGCLALGELIIYLTHIPLPSSILGMLLLTFFLKAGWIKLQWVQGLSDFLVANIGFFFVPPGVALMLYFDIIEAQFWPIVCASVVSTVLVLAITGWIHQTLTRGKKGPETNEGKEGEA